MKLETNGYNLLKRKIILVDSSSTVGCLRNLLTSETSAKMS